MTIIKTSYAHPVNSSIRRGLQLTQKQRLHHRQQQQRQLPSSWILSATSQRGGGTSASTTSSTSTVSIDRIVSDLKKQYSNLKKQSDEKNPLSYNHIIDHMLDTIYETADVNKDGRICFQECYELVLQLYVLINRQAPIPPPKRRTVMRLYKEYDRNNNRHISRKEFTSLSRRICQRAVARVVLHKVTTIVGAPVLAELTYRRFKDVKAIPLVLDKIPFVSKPLANKMATSPAFGRSVLLVAYVTTLGNVVTKSFTYVLQHTLPPEEQ